MERWLSYRDTCHVILLAKLHDMYLYKTNTHFHINHYFKVSLKGGSLTQVSKIYVVVLIRSASLSCLQWVTHSIFFSCRNKKTVSTFWLKKKKKKITSSGAKCNQFLCHVFVLMLNLQGKMFSRHYFVIFSQKSRLWHFMQIVSIGDNLHEMSKPLFLFRKNTKILSNCHLLN